MENSYSEIIFGKQLYNIEFEDIVNFFKEEQEENSILEFKSGDVSLETIFKEVCAFLNTEGGILIIGSPKEKRNGEKKVCSGELTNSSFNNKDWLSQKITSNIQTSPSGIQIIECEKDGVKIFICEIKQSLNPPHQCSSDGKYYIRLEAEAKFAPHGIVLALFNKRKVPEIKFDLNIDFEDFQENSNIFKALINVGNKSDIPTDTIHYVIELYNTEEAGKLRFNSIDSGEYLKLTTTGKIDIPLVFAISVPLEFTYMPLPLYRKYMISFYVWSKEISLTFKYWIIQTGVTNIEFTGDKYSKKTLNQAIDEVYMKS